ncbi:MAG: hypothetical protein KC713_02320 [Candidatus Omnitrophica bacterium]|nr:hypothetical protein [Candidatus Omnitrophota bacterium]
MKSELGLEAMLEYATKYVIALTRQHPALKRAVDQAVQHLDVKKIYREVCVCPKSMDE